LPFHAAKLPQSNHREARVSYPEREALYGIRVRPCRLKLSLLQDALDAYYPLVTVLEVIQRSTEFLRNKGVDSPRLQTELLLAHLLKIQRMQLYLNFERKLSETEVNEFRQLIKRRGRREPLQHIVGSTSFCGLELTVNRHVLVPRPETELVAEQGWKFLQKLRPGPLDEAGLGQCGTPHPNPVPIGWGGRDAFTTPTALDLGTGSGCIAIALVVHAPAARVLATEISAEALELAKQNAARHNVLERIDFFQGDAFAAFSSSKRFDLIISNPPYIPTDEITSLQIEVRDYDPRQALDGGPDGLVFYRRIADEAAPFLKPGGKIMLELGDGQAEAVREIFESQKWIVEAIIEDYTQRPRILIAHG
jgi:release factor glutamine methyltransferase